jgi:hypothetical protein
MRRNFNFSSLQSEARQGGPGFWLKVLTAVLAVANAIALFFYIAPPGGSQSELVEQRQQLRTDILGTRHSAARLQTVSGKVQQGSTQADDFESKYFLSERLAFENVIAEVQRMAKASGLEAREAVYSKEPIEGSDDLSVLNIAQRFNGSYQNLMNFLHQADTSKSLLMLDTLQATPQQHNGQIEAEIRFQAVIRDEASSLIPVQQNANSNPGGQP